MNIQLIFACLFGLTSVLIASYIEHGLAAHIDNKTLNSLQTAVRYQQGYAILIAALSLYLWANPNKLIYAAAWLFIIGIGIFSGSIYAGRILNYSLFLRAAPIGGVILMLSWLVLCLAGFVKR